MKILFPLVFHAFIFWSFTWVFMRQSTPSGIQADKIDRVVTRVAIAIGAIEIISFIWRILDESIQAKMMEWAFGEHWFGFWIYPFTYVILMQLLWLEAMRKNKIFRFILALWILLLLHMEVLIILITSFHRDYMFLR